MASVSVSGNKVFCPLDHATMAKGQIVPHQNGTDNAGNPILVTMKYYQCPECGTVVAFSFREDGKVGELKQALDFEKKHGKLLKGEIVIEK